MMMLKNKTFWLVNATFVWLYCISPSPVMGKSKLLSFFFQNGKNHKIDPPKSILFIKSNFKMMAKVFLSNSRLLSRRWIEQTAFIVSVHWFEIKLLHNAELSFNFNSVWTFIRWTRSIWKDLDFSHPNHHN